MTDINDMKALHEGYVQKRTWHKIRWTSGKHTGGYDIFDDEDLAKNRDSVEVVETFKTDMCSAGVSMDFGRTNEEKIDKWIKENKR